MSDFVLQPLAAYVAIFSTFHTGTQAMKRAITPQPEVSFGLALLGENLCINSANCARVHGCVTKGFSQSGGIIG
jgi:hypothetical protein